MKSKIPLRYIILVVLITYTTCLAGDRSVVISPDKTESFQYDYKPQRAEQTPWTRWRNTFDFRRGAGDPDFYRGSFAFIKRPGNYRTMTEGRFETGAPLYLIRGRTEMLYRFESNCGTWQSTIELFVRSKPGTNIWNDSKEHCILHLSGCRTPGMVSPSKLNDVLPGAKAVKRLSQKWQFKTDPKDQGVANKWYSPDLDDSQWAIVRSDMGGWEKQGL